ncbi:hypothetical protein BG011_010219 [Mortierella polycephala]|uniref:F-box domain-containing protein n=1 Tax=Mortierella polycephala TaxID=41804 RepID=A0A9P6PM66_9FUNG|nr:hypothetical protein BG011_010219 [Mortierella polycephala]
MKDDSCIPPTINFASVDDSLHDTKDASDDSNCTDAEHWRLQDTTAITVVRASLHTLPAEVVFYIMDSLLPRHILVLAKVSRRLRILSLEQLAHVYDISLGQISGGSFVDQEMTWTNCAGSNDDNDSDINIPNKANNTINSNMEPISKIVCVSGFELYVRLTLSEIYHHETACPKTTDGKGVVRMTLTSCKKILRRLYLMDPSNKNWVPVPSDSSSSSSLQLNPYVTSLEGLHVVSRVIVDQVCRGICLPETAVLILQTLTSLWDQDQFQYQLDCPDWNADLRLPPVEDQASMGQLSFQYLVPNILTLLKPHKSPTSTMQPPTNALSVTKQDPDTGATIQNVDAEVNSSQSSRLPTPPHFLHFQSLTKQCKSLTNDALAGQQALLQPLCIRSITHLTRVLCFLPLLGRHFNALPTTTFIETFLDRSGGDLSMDRAVVMVYGFMCVLDLESGKANLAADSYKIFEKTMPTQGVVQAKEMVRVVERHRLLVLGFVLSSPTFSSTRFFGASPH